MAESDKVLNALDGVILFTDGTHSYVVSREVGDAAFADDSVEVEHYLDRGRIAGPGSARRVDEKPIALTFTAHMRATVTGTDDVSLIGLANWSRGNGVGDAAVVAAGWTSTATLPDGGRTLHCDWYPAGNDTGAFGVRIPDALIKIELAEGRPNTVKVTASSTSAAAPEEVEAP
jgi:hypothetical protein